MSIFLVLYRNSIGLHDSILSSVLVRYCTDKDFTGLSDKSTMEYCEDIRTSETTLPIFPILINKVE
jgi:hypothetical protein